MKKQVLIAAALFSTVFSFAQESSSSDDGVVKNKKGHEILPKEGDIALGFNAIPALDLVFNALRYVSIMGNSAGVSNGTANNANQYVASSANQIVGKYFLSDKMAIRAKIGVNTLTHKVTNRIQDAEAMGAAVQGGSATDIQAASLIQVEDKLNYKKSNNMFVAGVEFRRGYRRLQGYYGGEIGIGGESERYNISYGNAFSDQYQVQYTTNWNNGATSTQDPLNNRITRTLTSKNRGSLILGARGFVGIEYFVFAKISVAAEYGWGYTFQRTKGVVQTQEVYQIGASGPEVFEEELNLDYSTSTKGFSVDNNRAGNFSLSSIFNSGAVLNGGSGAITLLFHF
jgi:hypothetical protein